MKLSLDFETRGTIDLRRTGVYPYAIHRHTDIWCMAYAFGDEEPELWLPGDPFPERIGDQIRDIEFHAWNAGFERVLWWLNLTPRRSWPRPEREQFFCTAATAANHALPRKLSKAATVLGIEEQIHQEKHGLILRMAKPRKVHKDGTITWWDVPDRLEQLYDACKQDVRTERAIGAVLRPLTPSEREVYLLDQRMNDRGVKLDRELVEASEGLVREATRRAEAELSELTNGELTAITKVADMTTWLQAAGAPLDNLQKSTVRDLLEDDEVEIPDDVRRVLELRAETAKSSTGKLRAMLEYCCADDRLRGMLLYHGASTGRWSGKGPQPQNYPRPTVKDVERFIDLVLAQDYDAIEREVPVLVLLSSLLRSMLTSRDGYRLIAGDFAQIEARVLAWLAEQEDLVELFANDGKVYEDMGAFIFGKPIEEVIHGHETGEQPLWRFVGKETILGAGFQMGAITFAENVQKKTGILLEEEVAEQGILGYREKNYRIKAFWGEINDAAANAVANPGEIHTCGRDGCIRFVVRGHFLWCQLPSGRFLAYARPALKRHTVKPRKGDPFTTTSVRFMGMDGYVWRSRFGYGGLWTENVVQAIARDLMAGALLRLEGAGYRPVMTVHDEAVLEEPLGKGSLDEALKLMEQRPRWAAGLPVRAEGWEGSRYRK